MRRLLPLIFALPLALGCASTASHTAGSAGNYDYARGMNSPWSMRLDGLDEESALGPETSLQEGLLAGDQEFWAAAALFRQGDHLGLDLIFLNRSGEELMIKRTDLQLFDGEGRLLMTVEDFPGADDIGLRSRLPLPERPARFEIRPTQASAPTRLPGYSMEGKGSSAPAMAATAPSWPVELVGSSEVPRRANSPRRLTLPTGKGSGYWAYFRDSSPVWPITAVLMMEDEQLVFRFGAPQG